MKDHPLAVVITIFAFLIGGYLLFIKTRPAPSYQETVLSTAHYSCTDGSIDAGYAASSVTLALSDGRSMVLPQTVSASGTRYEKNSTVFVTKGDNAFLEENGKTTYGNCVINTAATPSPDGMLSFTDQGNTIKFSYPKEFILSGGGVGYTEEWRTNTTTLGIVLAKVTIPKSWQPQTNFSEAVFRVGTSSDTDAVKNCLIAQNGERVKGTATVNGVVFTKITLTDAGVGNWYDTTSYHALRNDQCYVVEYTIHSTRVGNYPPELGITEFDTQKVVGALESMVQSFEFAPGN